MNTNQNKPVSLRAVVAELLACYAQVNRKRSTQIINSVSDECTITRGENWLAPLMGDLYAILSAVRKNDQVYISAKEENGGYKLYAAQKKTTKPNELKIKSRQTIPTLTVLPAKFHFGFRA